MCRAAHEVVVEADVMAGGRDLERVVADLVELAVVHAEVRRCAVGVDRVEHRRELRMADLDRVDCAGELERCVLHRLRHGVVGLHVAARHPAREPASERSAFAEQVVHAAADDESILAVTEVAVAERQMVRAVRQVGDAFAVSQRQSFDADVARRRCDIEHRLRGEQEHRRVARVEVARHLQREPRLVAAPLRAHIDALVGAVPEHARAAVVGRGAAVVLGVGREVRVARVGHEAPAAVGVPEVAEDLARARECRRRAPDRSAGVVQRPVRIACRTELRVAAVDDHGLAGMVADRDWAVGCARRRDAHVAFEVGAASHEQRVACRQAGARVGERPPRL